MQRFFSFDGRATRSEWWAINLVLMAPMAILGDMVMKDSFAESLARTIVFIIAIPFIWLAAASSARRFHDRDKNGFWYLIVLVPGIGPLWLVIECGFLPGTIGANSYGQRVASPLDVPR